MISEHLPSTRKPPIVLIERATQNTMREINDLIVRAVMAWPLAARVKRRASTVLQYDSVDFDSFEIYCGYRDAALVGTLAIDDELTALDAAKAGMLVHGVYVDPAVRGQGIGRVLLQFAEQQALAGSFDGVVIKAQRVSRQFFERCAYTHFPPTAANDYPYLYWKALAPDRG